MSIISDTSNEVIKEPLFWASLLEAAGARPGCCCERDSPWLRLKIKQHRIKATRRLHSFHRDRRHRTPLRVAGAGIFGFAVIVTVGMLVVSIQQMVDGGYANAAYADVPFRHCWWLQWFRITQARRCLCLQIKLDEKVERSNFQAAWKTWIL